MNRAEFVREYWNYYCSLEKKFLDTTNYVYLDQSNYNTFSYEYFSLLQIIGAELNNMFKLFCGHLPEDTMSISDYADYMKTNYPSVVDEKLRINESGFTIQPFLDWDFDKPAKSLSWWSAFVSIKHGRGLSIKEANLENVLNALGALYLLEMKFLQIIVTDYEPQLPDHPSNLFSTVGWHFNAAKIQFAMI